MAHNFEIVYNSDLIIRDSAEAATLCVFYDRVILPYTTRATSANFFSSDEIRQEGGSQVADWELSYGTLFDSGVLSRLPAPKLPEYEAKESISYLAFPDGPDVPRDLVTYDFSTGSVVSAGSCSGDYSIDQILRNHKGKIIEWGHHREGDEIRRVSRDVDVTAWSYAGGPQTLRVYKTRIVDAERTVLRTDYSWQGSPKNFSDLLSQKVHKFDSGNVPLIRQDIAVHLLREDITQPQIFASAKARKTRDILIALEACATFSYLLPKIHVYHPTQILELRDKVKDTREGFTMHLWKLSNGLQARAGDGASLSETASYARDLIETELIPDYREFQRQLQSMEAGRWNKVMDAAGKIIEINATPWTPHFWAQVMKAIGLSALVSESERKEQYSNKYQAFKFMSDLEQSTNRY